MGGAVLMPAIVLIVLVGLLGYLAWFFYCPCERTPGGYLLGNVITRPVQDWTFANDVPLCQVEVSTGVLPHSINLNCMASEGELYLSCANCDGKRWSTAALKNPDARLRLDDDVYPVRLSRVTDPSTLDRAWIARAQKRNRPTDQPRQEGWWSFRVESRPSSAANG